MITRPRTPPVIDVDELLADWRGLASSTHGHHALTAPIRGRYRRGRHHLRSDDLMALLDVATGFGTTPRQNAAEDGLRALIAGDRPAFIQSMLTLLQSDDSYATHCAAGLLTHYWIPVADPSEDEKRKIYEGLVPLFDHQQHPGSEIPALQVLTALRYPPARTIVDMSLRRGVGSIAYVAAVALVHGGLLTDSERVQLKVALRRLARQNLPSRPWDREIIQQVEQHCEELDIPLDSTVAEIARKAALTGIDGLKPRSYEPSLGTEGAVAAL